MRDFTFKIEAVTAFINISKNISITNSIIIHFNSHAIVLSRSTTDSTKKITIIDKKNSGVGSGVILVFICTLIILYKHQYEYKY